MDTSDLYIIMCREAEEIQSVKLKSFNGVRHYDPGDNFYFNEKVYILGGDTRGLSNKETVWLPRQDQLQDILYKDGDRTKNMVLRNFALSLSMSLSQDTFPPSNIDLPSMEIIWLKFLMHYKYQKVWNKEKEIWL